MKGFLDMAKMARVTVAETLCNLSMARISDIKNIKASGNWMWAAKMEGEGVFTSFSGDVYVGMLKEDRFEGYGVITYSFGDRYEGQFLKGLPYGKCLRTLPLTLALLAQ